MWCTMCYFGLFVIPIIKLWLANTVPIISQQWPWGSVASPINPGRCRLEHLFLPLKILRKMILGNNCEWSVEVHWTSNPAPMMLWLLGGWTQATKKYYFFFFYSTVKRQSSGSHICFLKMQFWLRFDPEQLLTGNRNRKQKSGCVFIVFKGL